MKFKPLIENYPPYLKLMTLLIIILICMLFTSIVSYVLGAALFGMPLMQSLTNTASYADPAALRALKFFQIMSQIGVFILPVVVFSVLVSGKPTEFLRMRSKAGIVILVLSVLATVVANPLISWLAEANARMHLPSVLNDVEQWMKQSEADATNLTNAFLRSATWPGFLVNVLMMAILPALGEELLFRGVLIRIFREWFRDIHVAIFIAALIFSAVHLQFYGFFPRLMMGVMFGYLFYWSGSIWIPVLVHLVNNFIIVGYGFAYAKGVTEVSPEVAGSTDNVGIIIGSAVVLALILVVIFRRRVEEK